MGLSELSLQAHEERSEQSAITSDEEIHFWGYAGLGELSWVGWVIQIRDSCV